MLVYKKMQAPAITESKKMANIPSLAFPEFIRMATGSLINLKTNKDFNYSEPVRYFIRGCHLL